MTAVLYCPSCKRSAEFEETESPGELECRACRARFLEMDLAALPKRRPKKADGYAKRSLVYGIIALIFTPVCLLSKVFAVTAIICGIVALTKRDEEIQRRDRGMAIAGIALGTISALGSIVPYAMLHFM